MKVLHLSYLDDFGGAHRSAYRLHRALRRAGVDSQMLVKQASIPDWTVHQFPPRNTFLQRIVRKSVDVLLVNRFRTANPITHSPDFLSSVDVGAIEDHLPELIHLHWVQNGMLSIADVGRLHPPVVWTLHDMWAFCGAEHVTYEFRWKEGYRRDNRPEYESGFDLNRWTWERKRRQWKRPMQIVTPSRWMAECVRQSALMRDWPVAVIPNAIDTKVWQPFDKKLARRMFGLPEDVPLVLFGALGGSRDPNKGFELLQDALNHLRGEMPGLELLVLGQHAPQTPPELGFPTHYLGSLHDDLSLSLLYSAADLKVVPSRLENLPNTAVEAHACGTPVAAFDVGGVSDVVEHLRTGYLARPYDTADLAKGIQWVLGQREHGSLGERARERAATLFDADVIAERYMALYADVKDGKFQNGD